MWWKRYQNDGNFRTKARSGRKRKTTAQQDQEIIKEIRENPFRSATSIARKYQVCPNTITSRFKEYDIKCYTSAKQSKLTDEHRINRLAYCENMLNLDRDYLNSIVFSDEKTFCSDLDRKHLVYRPPNSRYEPEYVTEQRLSGRISATYWGAMTLDGPISDLIKVDGRFNSQKYIDILSGYVLPFIQESDQDYVFMQDNSPIHTSNIVMEYFSEHPIQLIDWPPYSPDLNPIENVWSIITRDWPAMENRNENALDELIQARWNELRYNRGLFRNLYNSLPNRFEEVIQYEGNWCSSDI